jgi:hypothetical protein
MQDIITSQFTLGDGIDLMTKHGPLHGIIESFGNVYIGITVDFLHSPVDIPYENIRSFSRFHYTDCDLGV